MPSKLIKNIKVLGILVVLLVVVSLTFLAFYSNKAAYARVTDFIRNAVGFGTYTVSVDFNNPERFAFDVQKVDVSNDGARLINLNEEAEIVSLDPIKIDPDSRIVGFTEDALKWRGSSIGYQITTDYNSWYYFNGSGWIYVGNNCDECTNNAVEINQNIDTLPVISDGLQIKAVLESSGKPVVLYSVALEVRGRDVALTEIEEAQLMFTRAAHAKKNKKDDGDDGCDDGECESAAGCVTAEGDPNLPLDENYYSYYFTFDDGSTASGTSTDNVAETSANGTLMDLHVSCSDKFFGPDKKEGTADDGYGERGDPTESEGHPRVSTYQIWKYDVDKDGTCELKTECATPTAGYCGDGVVDSGEECDDGNNNNGDGCSAECEEECQECDGKITMLTMRYDGAESAEITVTQKKPDATIFSGIIAPAGTFTFYGTDKKGTMGTEIKIYVNGEFHASMHTSCSVDVGPGYTAGDFMVIYGESRNGGELCPVACEWDKSSLAVGGMCTDGNAVFTITNISVPLIGDMEGSTQYRIYRNNVLESTGTVKLNGGEFVDIVVAALGDTIRIEVDQRPCHPTGEYVSAEVKDCFSLMPPVAEDDYDTTLINTPVTVDVLSNDNDPDGVLVESTVDVTTAASHGSTSENPVSGQITYTPDFDFYGTDSFIYEVCDNHGLCDSATVTIDVLVPPTAVSDSETTVMNIPVDVSVLDNDSDVDGTLEINTLDVIENPIHGGVVENLDGTVTYTPEHNYYGTDSFKYEICDNDSLCDTAIVNILVLSPPIALDDSEYTNKNQPVNIDILDNDSDPDGILVLTSVTIESPPSHGNVSYDDSTGIATYTPNNGYSGLDEFEYRVCDNDSLCDTAIVTIGIDELLPPTANDDSESTRYETPIDISILDNDDDVDGVIVPSTAVVTVYPTRGLASIDSNGLATYTPNSGFYGTDTFHYRVCDDDGLCDTAMVTITVNAPPTAVDDFATTPLNTPVDIDIVLNDEDIDGVIDPTTVVITDLPDDGNVVVDPGTGVTTYTPDTDFTGKDTFDYSVCDNDGDCDEAVVTVYVEVDIIPPVAENDFKATFPSTPVDVYVLDNDYDIDGNLVPSTVTVLSGPGDGTVSVNSTTGIVTYTPDVGFSGYDYFTYEVCDNDALCDTADVTIDVGGGPSGGEDPPLAVDDYATTDYETPIDITILNNDSDPDGNLDESSATIIDFPTNGSASVNGSGISTYAPNAGFWGVDTYIYRVCDTTNRCDTANVTVTVLAPPIANDDSATTDQGIPVDIPILDNDDDPDGVLVPGTVKILTPPSNGGVSFSSGTEQATYTPDPGYLGVDSFVYEVCDDDGMCDAATATIGIGEVLPPVAVDDSASTDEGESVDIDLVDNDYDIDGVIVPSTTVIIGQPTNGIATVDSNGLATYTPNTGFSGIDIFVYQVCDNDGLCDLATVAVTVIGIIIPPPPPPPPPGLIIPPIVLPVPDVGEVIEGISILDEFCDGRVYFSPNITFVGTAGFGIDEISELQYSLSDGLGWNNINRIAATSDASTVFNFTVADLQPGAYSGTVRIVTTDGEIFSSVGCEFNIHGDLIFGANQFILPSQQAPLSDYGVIQFEAGVPQVFYLEAEAAAAALVRVKETQEEFPLTYDLDLKLWTGTLLFDTEGTYHLEAFIGNNLGEAYHRDINTVLVTETTPIENEAGDFLDNAVATIYVKDPLTGEFNIWVAEAFAGVNPLPIPDGLSVVLPSGEYYIEVSADGYTTITSLIVRVDEQSIVTAPILMSESNLGSRVRRFFTGEQVSDNFSLNVEPLPQDTLLEVGEIVPEVSATTQLGREVTLFSGPSDVPTVVFVHSYWNTAAQEQQAVYETVSRAFGGEFNFVPMTTMEPDNLNLTQYERGDYEIDFYKPDASFFDSYMITSLPTFMFLNENRELLGILQGAQSMSALTGYIDQIFE